MRRNIAVNVQPKASDCFELALARKWKMIVVSTTDTCDHKYSSIRKVVGAYYFSFTKGLDSTNHPLADV